MQTTSHQTNWTIEEPRASFVKSFAVRCAVCTKNFDISKSWPSLDPQNLRPRLWLTAKSQVKCLTFLAWNKPRNFILFNMEIARRVPWSKAIVGAFQGFQQTLSALSIIVVATYPKDPVQTPAVTWQIQKRNP